MRKKQKIINLYGDAEIYAIKQVVSIGDEEDLNQLWEYVMGSSSGERSDIYPFLVGFYELASRFVESRREAFFEVILEESDRYHYFTVWNREFLHFSRREWKKKRMKYRTDTNRITVRLSKSDLKEKTGEYFQRETERIDRLGTISDGG